MIRLFTFCRGVWRIEIFVKAKDYSMVKWSDLLLVDRLYIIFIRVLLSLYYSTSWWTFRMRGLCWIMRQWVVVVSFWYWTNQPTIQAAIKEARLRIKMNHIAKIIHIWNNQMLIWGNQRSIFINMILEIVWLVVSNLTRYKSRIGLGNFRKSVANGFSSTVWNV